MSEPGGSKPPPGGGDQTLNLWPAEQEATTAGPSLQQQFENFGTSFVGSFTRSSGLTRLFGESLGEKTFSGHLRDTVAAIAERAAMGGMPEAKAPGTQQFLPPATVVPHSQVQAPIGSQLSPLAHSAALKSQSHATGGTKRKTEGANAGAGSTTSSQSVEDASEARSSGRSGKVFGVARRLGGSQGGGGSSPPQFDLNIAHDELGLARSKVGLSSGLDEKSLDMRTKNMLKSRRHRQRKKEQEALLHERINQLEGELASSRADFARIVMEARTESARLEKEKDQLKAELARVGVAKLEALLGLPLTPSVEACTGDPKEEIERLRVENATLREGYRNMLETMTKLLRARKEGPLTK